MNAHSDTSLLSLKAAAHDAQVRHARLVQRCQDEAGTSGISKLRVKRDAALVALLAAENALARAS